jgi:predicted MFS family arabinose efflux permease
VGGGLGSLSIAFAHIAGWRAVSNVVAGFGIFSALAITMLIAEPDRQQKQSGASAKTLSFFGALQHTFRDRVVIYVLLGSCLRFLGGFSLG